MSENCNSENVNVEKKVWVIIFGSYKILGQKHFEVKKKV